MYLLDRATKLENGERIVRSYLIEDDEVRYVNESFRKWIGMRVSMAGTIMMNGRVMLANSLLRCETVDVFHEEQMQLLKKGCTTFAVAPDLYYENNFESVFQRAKHRLINSTLDFIIGCTIPVRLLKPRFIQKCQKRRIPFLRIAIDQREQLDAIPWAYLSTLLLSYPIVLIPKTDEQEILQRWFDYCDRYQIHTSKPIDDYEVWDKSLLQKVGLYPKKGAFLVGSNADYLLFPENEIDLDEPAIVIIRGKIVKDGERCRRRPGFGKLIDIKRPSQFLSIDYIEHL